MPQVKLPPPSRQVSRQRIYYLDTRLRTRSGIRVTCMGHEWCRPDYRLQREGFPGFGIELIVQGRGRLELDGRPHVLQAGVFFCYGPRTSHLIQSDPSQPLVKYFLDCLGDAAPRLLAEAGLRPGQVMQTTELPGLISLFDLMLEEASRPTSVTQEIAGSLLRILLLKCAHAPHAPRSGEDAARKNFLRCRAHLDKHFTELQGLQDAADALRLPVSYMCRLFKKYGTSTPHQYLTSRKMMRAAALVGRENMPIQNAAAAVGYDDPFHFSRIFKRTFGLSPRAFRKQQDRHSRSSAAASPTNR